ncbi:hypothetical protein DRE_00355 [Drechslerella stenobrocha 248]|uniref:GST N-terminal domain-containing protein n=1 Tax=Drechslerella stenobrocha 248 TaxID=1043628 RepID=W7I4K7_9PEZI|nr:hypothetical protein DRE_00355 [Drechslerella stenobrocha 248]
MATATSANPVPDIDITLYYDAGCPYVHRVVTTLDVLSLPYKKVTVDISKPREQWYLDINPTGKVPAVIFTAQDHNNGQPTTLTESLVITQFLSDLVPGRLLPAPGGIAAAVTRARVAFFVDAWSNTVAPAQGALMGSVIRGADVSAPVEAFIKAAGEVDALLVREGAAAEVLFGDDRGLSYAQIVAAPMLLRVLALADVGLLPGELKDRLLALPEFGRWTKQALQDPVLLKSWDVPAFEVRAKAMVAKAKEEQRAAAQL